MVLWCDLLPREISLFSFCSVCVDRFLVFGDLVVPLVVLVSLAVFFFFFLVKQIFT